jgi:hypothetical protein
MVVYNYSQARQRLSAILDQALRDGQVRLRAKDGRTFVIKPEPAPQRSPLNVQGLNSGISKAVILAVITEGRERS